MSFKIPTQIPVEKDDVVLSFDNQTFIQFNRKKECIKRPIKLDQHLIIVILKGTKVMISTEEDITVKKNELLFLEKGAYLSSEKILEDGAFSSLLFFLQDDFLNQFKTKYSQYLGKVDDLFVPKMFKVETSSNIETYVQSLLPYFDTQQKIAQPILRLKIEELLLSLLFSDQKKQFNRYLLSLGQSSNMSFKETIEQSIFKNLTIEERAFLSNLSVSSFKRRFKEVFHDSPAHWFRNQRLKRARILISTTDKTISEVAFEVGFESTSHFIHIFKKQYGITPKQLSS